MDYFYTSDLHLNSYGTLKKTNRPFSSVEKMNHTLIWNINEVTNRDSILVIDGDACSGMHYSVPELKQIRCRKILIIGNHDEISMQYGSFRRCFEDIQKSMVIKDGEHEVFLSHYPHADWKGSKSGRIHLYGHIHETDCGPYMLMKCIRNAYNVGVDHNNYYPVTLNQLLAKKIEIPSEMQSYIQNNVYTKHWA